MHRPSSFEKQIIYLFQGFANESCLQRFLFSPGFVSTLGSAFGLAPALAGLRPRFFTPMFPMTAPLGQNGFATYKPVFGDCAGLPAGIMFLYVEKKRSTFSLPYHFICVFLYNVAILPKNIFFLCNFTIPAGKVEHAPK